MMPKMNSEASAQLIQVLEKTVSVDKNELESAQNFLEQAAQTNLPEFLKTLSDVLHHGGNSQVARMAAGLQLKNHLVAKDPNIKLAYQQRWRSFPEETRNYIKKNILGALGTENARPSSAAQCVACVAVTEIPVGQWSDVITILTSNVVGPNSTELMKEATLEAIGYICQAIEQDALLPQSNQILTAIIHGMRSTETSNHVRLAATNALLNSLEFTRGNFEEESERNYIMEVVCEATQSSDTQVRVAALQCLVKIMTLYYQHMEPYMGQALFPITLEAMKSDINDIALQGIEFWSNVSEEEGDLQIEELEAAELGRPPTRTSRFYAKGALQYLVPVVLSKLTKQTYDNLTVEEEFDDEDAWNPSKAAGVCLMLLATCCEDSIVQYVLPFVQQNIKSSDWRYRDAALMAFGGILGGLQAATLKPLVEQAMPTLIELMYDNSAVVRDTAAWTFGRICEVVPEAATNETFFKPLLESLINGLKAEPRVAANVCWAFTGLAEARNKQADTDGNQPETYILTPYFEYIVHQLLETTDRVDGAKANLRSAAYEALMELVKNSPKDCYVTVQKVTTITLERLNHVLAAEQHIQNPSDRAQFNDHQGLLCTILQSALSKMTPEDAPKISDHIMAALLQIFSTYSDKSGAVLEDAIMAVSALVEAIGEDFKKYMPAFKTYLCLGLSSRQAHEVCCAAIGLTGDIFRTLGEEAQPYCDEIMTLLLEAVADPHVHRSIKPETLTVFGEIALGIGPEFKRYLEPVLSSLQQASYTQVDTNDPDLYEWALDLRKAIMTAYSGIIQGLKSDDPTALLALLDPVIRNLIQFVTALAADGCTQDSELKTWAGLIGDMCSFGPQVTSVLDTDLVRNRLSRGCKSANQKTRKVCMWATTTLQESNPGALASGDANRMEGDADRMEAID